jgi:spermidine synthase
VFHAFQGGFPKPEVAVIGLGAGTLAAYAKKGERWWFYEIDPVVVKVARSRALFTYVGDSKGTVQIVLGDARLSLERAPDGHLSLLVVDAFSSDSIPVHLLTREAVSLYRAKLASDGLVAFHISNQYLDLMPVLANLADDAGLLALKQDQQTISSLEDRMGYQGSLWVVMGEPDGLIGRLTSNPRWDRLGRSPGRAVWTDDYSNVLSTIRWR